MPSVRVTHSIGDLASDLTGIAKKARPDMVKVVREGVKVGTSLARDYAKESSGVHGKNYYKRISGEMFGVVEFGGVGGISGEYGPHDGGTPVGAGWRHAPPNTDLTRSADVIGPAFVGEVRRLPDKWFW